MIVSQSSRRGTSKSSSQSGSYNNSRRNSTTSSPNLVSVGIGGGGFSTLDNFVGNNKSDYPGMMDFDNNDDNILDTSLIDGSNNISINNNDIEISESKRRKLESVMSGDMSGITQIGFGATSFLSNQNNSKIDIENDENRNDNDNIMNQNSQRLKKMSVDNVPFSMNGMKLFPSSNYHETDESLQNMIQQQQGNGQAARRRLNLGSTDTNSREMSLIGKKRKSDDVPSMSKQTQSKRHKKSSKRANSETPHSSHKHNLTLTPFTLAAQAKSSASNNSNNNNNNVSGSNGTMSLKQQRSFTSMSKQHGAITNRYMFNDNNNTNSININNSSNVGSDFSSFEGNNNGSNSYNAFSSQSQNLRFGSVSMSALASTSSYNHNLALAEETNENDNILKKEELEELEQQYIEKVGELEEQLKLQEIETNKLKTINDNNVSKLKKCETIINKFELENEDLTNQLRHSNEILNQYNIEKERNDRARDSLIRLLREKAQYERREREQKLIENNKLIGHVIQQSDRFQIHDLWQDGQLFENLKHRIKLLNDEKKEIDDKRKELKKRQKQRLNSNNNNNNNNNHTHSDSNTNINNINNNNNNNNKMDIEISSSNTNLNNQNDMDRDTHIFAEPEPLTSFHTKSQKFQNLNNFHSKKKFDSIAIDLEILSLRRSVINKQLSELTVEQRDLEHRKKLHIKFIRLMRDESKSRFSANFDNITNCDASGKNKLLLNDRYFVTNLLGKGGFSEVHRAYDLQDHVYVACKIHQLNSHWSEDRKKNYTKHATREYDIQKKLKHIRIVQLFDVFGIDVNCFCTVLEYCDGMDLDIYLKMHHILSEKESKSIIVQVFEGLEYLHNQPLPIIHYDLKPGNLLYKCGSVKLTDFGLAKIMEQNVEQMELTSQGAGTYWYLPPECFVLSNNPNEPVMITTKVDIWSAGVIFYQMLFGKKPYGNDQTQDKILSDNIILKAKQVSFPNASNSSNNNNNNNCNIGSNSVNSSVSASAGASTSNGISSSSSSNFKVSEEAKQLIRECLSYSPKDRMSASDILHKHPYFEYLRK